MAEIKNIPCTINNTTVLPNIVVNCGELPRFVKIKDAVIKLVVDVVDELSPIYVNVKKSAEFPYWSENIEQITDINTGDNVILHIGDELQYAIEHGYESFILDFVQPEGIASVLKFVEQETFVTIEYSSKTEYVENGTSHEIDINSAGQAKIYLNTGELQINHTDLTTNTKVLPLTISHVFNSFKHETPSSTNIKNYYGKNWKLNIEQYLLRRKIFNDTTSTEKDSEQLVYLDSNGNEQIIIEKFYYLDSNNEKIYIENKDDIYMTLSGTLEYKDQDEIVHEVLSDLEAPSGLKLVTSKRDIKGAELVDSEPEEVINARNQLKSLKLNKQSLQNSIDSYKYQLAFYGLSKHALKEQLKSQGISLEASAEDNTYLEKIQSDRNTYSDTTPENAPITGQLQQRLNREDYVHTYGGSGSYYYDYKGTLSFQKKLQCLNSKFYDNNIEIEDFKQYMENNLDGELQDIIEFTGLSYELGIKDIFDHFVECSNDPNIIPENPSTDEKPGNLGRKDLWNIDIQIKALYDNFLLCKEQIADYDDQIEKLEYQVKEYDRQLPVYYLYSDNCIFGFAKTQDDDIFRLSYIADNFENSISISYEENTNKITNVVDSSDQVILFNYDDTHLVSIVDNQDKIIKFNYTDDYLTEIVYNDETSSNYIYDTNTEKLVGAISSNGQGVAFIYEVDKIKQIYAISNLLKVENGQASFNTTQITADNILDFQSNEKFIVIKYNNYKSTTIGNFVKESTDKIAHLNSLTYIFNNDGKVKIGYQNEFDAPNPDNSDVVVKTYEYTADKESLSVQSLLGVKNYLYDACFGDGVITQQALNYLGDDLICGDEIYCETYPIHQSYHELINNTTASAKTLSMSDLNLIEFKAEQPKSLILGGWAKADSAYVISNDEVSDLSKEDYLEYVQNRKFTLRAQIKYSDNTIDTFERNFDWMNTGWQYCAVPIIPNYSKDITDIDCTVDYSNNTGTIYFTDPTLKEAIYERKTYIDKKLDTVTSSNSKWIAKYHYDEDDKLTSVVYKNSDTNEEFKNEFFYNKNGVMFKSIDYKGIVTEKIFNEYGSEIKTKTYHKDNPAEIQFSEQKLGDNGEVIADYNELGEEINSYEYVGSTNTVSKIYDKQGNATAYGYDNKNDTLLQISTDVSGESNTNTYGYANGYLTSIAHNNFDITYDYDNRGRVSKIMVAGSDYAEFNYDNINNANIVTYSNEESFKTVTDKDGNIIEVYYKPSPKETETTQEFILVLENFYDTYGNLLETVEHNDTNTNRTYFYRDKFGNITQQTADQHNLKVDKVCEFDNNNHETSRTYTFNEITTSAETDLTTTLENTNTLFAQNYTFNYDTTKPESILSSVVLPTNAVQSTKNDNLDRTKEIVLNNIVDNETKTATRLFHYLKNGDHTSNLVSSIWFGDSDKYLDNLKYKYDEKGNITEVYENCILQVRYKYDSLSRLIREDNKPLSKTTTWEYDAGGNILNRFEYEFTTIQDLSNLSPIVIPYAYAVTGIRDELVEYNGKSFVYDAIGNPTLYQNNLLVWEKGRQLKSYGNIANYTYNASGIRTGKTVGTTTTQFFLDGTKILAQKDIVSAGENTTTETLMQFIYGVDGIIGFTINNENYYYKKNLQGDIIGIYDNNLQIIAKYTYDAWGNHKLSYLNGTEFVDFDPTKPYTIDNDNLYIALKNPFRYRSYYYDFETGLYYLNSRYYDPEIGRFINIDDITVLDITNIALNGINLYAYCLNNPVNEVDESGKVLLTLLIAALVGMAASAIVSVGTQLITTGTVNGWQVLTDALFGGLAGMVAVSGLGAVGLFFAQGLISAGNTVVNSLISGEYITGYDVASSFIFGGIMGALGDRIDLRRISQIEGSMRNTLISKFRNGGWKAFSAAFTDKTRKYTSEFVMPYLKSLFIDSAISIPILIGNTFLSDYIRAKY